MHINKEYLMIANETTQQLQQLYITYFGRPGEPAGLEWWAGRLGAGELSIDQVAQEFSKADEFANVYGGAGFSALIEALYVNALGRAIESQQALEFWVNQLESGLATPGVMVTRLLGTDDTNDRQTIANRVEAAKTYTESVAAGKVSYNPAAANALIKKIDATEASVTKALEEAGVITPAPVEEPEQPGGGSGGSVGGGSPTTPVEPAFALEKVTAENNGYTTTTVSFAGTATGPIFVARVTDGNGAEQISFTRDGVTVSLEENGNTRVELADELLLMEGGHTIGNLIRFAGEGRIEYTQAFTLDQFQKPDFEGTNIELTYTISDQPDNLFAIPQADTLTVELKTTAADASLYVLTSGELDISSLKQGGTPTSLDLADAAISGDVIVTVAELNQAGNKSDIGDGTAGKPKSDFLITLPSLEHIEGSLTIAGMTISSTAGYTHEPVANDQLDFNAWGVTEQSFIDQVDSIIVTSGSQNGPGYINLGFDFDGDDEADLILADVVSDNVYNKMLVAIDMVNDLELDSTLDLVNYNGTLSTNGVLADAFNYQSGASSEAKVILKDGGHGNDAIIGLVGILFDEGTFVSGNYIP